MHSERMMIFPDRLVSRSIYQCEFGFEMVGSKKQLRSHLPEKLNKALWHSACEQKTK